MIRPGGRLTQAAGASLSGIGAAGGLTMALRIGTTLPCSAQRALRCPGNATTGRLQCGQTVWTGCEFVMTRFLCEWALLPIGFVYTAIVPAVQQKLLLSNIGSGEDTVTSAIPGFGRQFSGAALGGSAWRPI